MFFFCGLWPFIFEDKGANSIFHHNLEGFMVGDLCQWGDVSCNCWHMSMCFTHMANTPIMSLIFWHLHSSGNLLMKSWLAGGSSSRIAMSTPPFMMCCLRYTHAGSEIEWMTTSGFASLILSQCFTISLQKLRIILGSASFLSLWTSLTSCQTYLLSCQCSALLLISSLALSQASLLPFHHLEHILLHGVWCWWWPFLLVNVLEQAWWRWQGFLYLQKLSSNWKFWGQNPAFKGFELCMHFDLCWSHCLFCKANQSDCRNHDHCSLSQQGGQS